MRACVQRVRQAQVIVADEVCGQIDQGLVVLLGVGQGDEPSDAGYLADKIVELRVFDDAQGKMNRSLIDVHGSLLVVSQFTLYGDCRRGRRPSFTDAAPPETAESLYQTFVAAARARGVDVACGQFRQHMLVQLINDGPVTILLDSKKLF